MLFDRLAYKYFEQTLILVHSAVHKLLLSGYGHINTWSEWNPTQDSDTAQYILRWLDIFRFSFKENVPIKLSESSASLEFEKYFVELSEFWIGLRNIKYVLYKTSVLMDLSGLFQKAGNPWVISLIRL